jgi:hypothetical protein
MLHKVELEAKSLTDYTPIVGREVIESIRQAAGPLRDARVLHVNATPFGGGVTEMLYTLVPLMRACFRFDYVSLWSVLDTFGQETLSRLSSCNRCIMFSGSSSPAPQRHCRSL